MPERTLKRRFRQATGLAVIDYLQSLRIEEAKVTIWRPRGDWGCPSRRHPPEKAFVNAWQVALPDKQKNSTLCASVPRPASP